VPDSDRTESRCGQTSWDAGEHDPSNRVRLVQHARRIRWVMISAQVNGAFLGLSDPYLLQTVGSVVVGGTLIFGGRAVPLGTLLGSLFLVLRVTATQAAGLKIGGQLMAEGLFIMLVLFLATERTRQ
jgi:ribose/xylose/arabinose/galactoside ABC-type transport system permease subunit